MWPHELNTEGLLHNCSVLASYTMVFIVQRFIVDDDGSVLAIAIVVIAASTYALGDSSTPVAIVTTLKVLISIQIIVIVTFEISFRSTFCALVPDFAVPWLGGLATPDCYELGDNRVMFIILPSK